MSGNVTKHVTLMSELNRQVEHRGLLDVSEIEQELANAHDFGNQNRLVKEALVNPKFSVTDKLRLSLMYALRYETQANNELNVIRDLLRGSGASDDQVASLDTIFRYAGAQQRCGDAFGNKSFVKSRFRNFSRGLQGVGNIYTEHKPLLKSTLELIQANKLNQQEYPYCFGSPTKDPPQDVIVFIVGGITFEEAVTVHEFNTRNPNFRVMLGGTCIHNSKSFLSDVGSVSKLSGK